MTHAHNKTPEMEKTIKDCRARFEPEPTLFASGPAYLTYLQRIADEDVQGLKKAQESYGDSWKKRGGVGAYMMLVRKIDRMELQTAKHGYDVFRAVFADGRAEGLIDDIRDLRRYLLLVEGELRAQGLELKHRDNDDDETAGLHPSI